VPHVGAVDPADKASVVSALDRLGRLPLAAYSNKAKRGGSLKSRFRDAPIHPIPDRQVQPDPVEDDLRDRVVAVSKRVIGADEHLQFAVAAERAEAYRLDAALTAELARVIKSDHVLVERSLDLLDLPERGVWIEWPDAERRGDRESPPGATVLPSVVGALFCPAPDDDDRIVIMTAWSSPTGEVRHSHAAAAFSRRDTSVLAWGARTRFSGDSVESQARLLTCVQVYFPPGLADEIDYMVEAEAEESDRVLGDMKGAREHAVFRAQMDLASDVPFAIAALLLLSADNVAFVPRSGRISLVDHRPRRVGILSRLAGVFGAEAPRGFVRSGRNAKAKVSFFPVPHVEPVADALSAGPESEAAPVATESAASSGVLAAPISVKPDQSDAD
jgi:hypothetical protein